VDKHAFPMSLAPSTKIATGAPRSAAGWRVLVVAGILALAALGAYWNSFNVPFLLDDSLAIGDNPSTRHLARIVDVLSPSHGPTAARPLVNLSFALNYARGDTSVRGYHALNLLIHICAGLALLGLVRRTLLLPSLRPRYGEAALPLAAFAAVLWTLHPLQTEAVTYLSQRAESLMGLFYLLTLYGFIRAHDSLTDVGRDRRTEPRQGRQSDIPPHREGNPAGFGDPALQQSNIGGSNPWLALSVAACLCGMATKQVMVTAPVLVLLYDRAFVSGSWRCALVNHRWYYAGLAATWLLLAFLMHRSSLAAAAVGFHEEVNWVTYALTELRVVTNYLKLACWPYPLVFDYGVEIMATGPWAVAPYALVMAAVLVGVAIAWRKSPMAGFIGVWFFLILAPTSTVVPISEQPMAESRMYLPLAAVVLLVTLLSYVFGGRRAFVVLGLVAVGLGALTVRRNHDYRSELSIWEDTVARQPDSSRGLGSLGMALAKVPGQMPAAIAHYEEALRIRPNYADGHNNFANALTKIPGRLPEAIAHYEEALRIKPAFAEVHNNLASALAKTPGRSADAIAHYEEALRLRPDLAETHYNLAVELAKAPGRLPDAVAHYETALRLKPDLAEAHSNLADALAKMPNRGPDAIAHYEEALRLKPDLVEAHNNLGFALAQIPGRLPEAIAHYQESLRLKPAYAEAHYNLANALAQLPGQLPNAVVHYEEALRLKPDSAEAHNNLGFALAQMPGRVADAVAHYEELCVSTPITPRPTTILAFPWQKCPAGCPMPSSTTKRPCVSNRTLSRGVTTLPPPMPQPGVWRMRSDNWKLPSGSIRRLVLFATTWKN